MSDIKTIRKKTSHYFHTKIILIFPCNLHSTRASWIGFSQGKDAVRVVSVVTVKT